MIEELKNLILAGLGSAAYTYEKAGKIINEMVQKGKLTVDEGKELSEELKRTVKEKSDNVKQKAEDIKPLTKEDMKNLLAGMNFATKDEIEDIKKRLDIIEEKVK